MTTITLPFGKVNIINNAIAEAIIDESVVMTADKLKTFHDALLSHFTSQPFSLLINKENSYTYDFEAQLNVGSLDQIDKTAVVAYSQISKLATRVIMSINQNKNWNVKMFEDRQDAIDWLLTSNKEGEITDEISRKIG